MAITVSRDNGKIRLDVLLVERGLFPSRESARRAVMAGLVTRNQEVLAKPGMTVHISDTIDVIRPEHPFVSRGGMKLARALSVFPVSVQDRVVIDVGASTGGFTDCALQNGARLVHAVDVGYGQLAWKLRNDDRVNVFERMNFRHASAHVFLPKPSVAVMDVSFISIRLLLDKILEVIEPTGDLLTLIKPQFEAGRDAVGKGGIVRDPNVHLSVLQTVLDYATGTGWVYRGVDYSPISGGDGNIEFLAWLQPGHETVNDYGARLLQVVGEAWQELRQQDVSDLIGQ